MDTASCQVRYPSFYMNDPHDTYNHSEYADITDTILKSTGPLNIGQVLNDPSIKPYFKSLTVRFS